MAWIESHQSIARHPKTTRLAIALQVSKSSAIGYLHMLWWWALDYAQDGDLSKYEVAEIEAGVEWEGESGQFVNALHKSGYLDDDDQLHDWFDYAGKLIEQREKDAERKREQRQKAKEKKKKDIPKMSGGRPVDIQGTSEVPTNQPTVPNQPNQTEPTNRENAAARLVREYEQIFSRLPNKIQIDDLLEYMDKGMELELLISALKETKRYGGGQKYTLSILTRQLDSGITTVAQAEINDAERQSMMGGLRYESTIHRQSGAGPDEPDPNSVEALLRSKGAT